MASGHDEQPGSIHGEHPRDSRQRCSLAASLVLGLFTCSFACSSPARNPASTPTADTPGSARPAPITKPISFSILEDYDKGADLQEVARDFALMEELGVKTWRGSFGWDDYEPTPGNYDFAWLHEFAALAARHGIMLRPYLGYTAPWAAKGGADDQYWNDPPARLQAWYDFVHHLVSALRQHPNILSYEIYNEQNAPLWWDGTISEYGAVLVQGAAAVRAADPDAQVILGGLTFPDAEWMEAICAAHGHASRFDIAAFHAYPETWTEEGVTVESYLDEYYRTSYTAAVNQECGGKPIWINEAGYATTPGRTEEQQASWWARAIATFLADPEVEHIGIYEIKDLHKDSPVIGDAPNYYLGITREDRTKKLAFHTLDLLTDLLDVGTITIADQELTVRVVSGTRGQLHHHLFRRPDARRVLLVWDRTGTPTLDIELAGPGSMVTEFALDGTAAPYPLSGSRTLKSIRLDPGVVRIFEIRP